MSIEDDKTASLSDRDRNMQKLRGLEGFADESDDDDDEKEDSKETKDDKKVEKNDRNDEDKAEKSKELVKLDKLSEDESKQVVEEYTEARAEDLREDLETAQPDSLEEAVALANAALIEAIQESEATTEEELDAALAETIEELGLEDDETEEADEDDPTVAAAPTTTASPTPVAPVAGGAGIPPIPPVTPPAPASPTPPGGPIGGGMPPVGPASPNILTNPNTTTNTTEAWRVNRRRAGQLLLMGAVGYMIGRRRGRINTEKRLLPVQEKLEKEVKTLHDQVAEREEKIRKLAAEKIILQPETVRPQIIERIQNRVERRQQPAEVPQRRPEALGKFVLPGAEVVRGVEVREKSVETMTMPELLRIANRIERDGVSVKEMYDNGRLDAIGLRRVVKEYLEGGDKLDRVMADNLRHIESYEGEPLKQQAQRDQPTGQGQSNAPLAPSLPYHFNNYKQSTQTPPPVAPAPVQAPQDKNILADNTTAIAAGVVAGIIILVILALFAL